MEAEVIASDEIILRRIPPDSISASTQARPEGGLRATSFRLKPAPDEEGISCSRLKQTAPTQLLELLKNQNISPSGWLVCRIRVSDVRKLGLDVVHVPTDEDPGHCEIRSTSNQPLNDRVCSKLAKTTRILTEEEVTRLQAGDILNE